MISCSAEVGGGGGRLQSHGGPTLTPGRLWYHFCPPYRWRWRFVSTLFQTAKSVLEGGGWVEWWNPQNKSCSTCPNESFATNFGWTGGHFQFSTLPPFSLDLAFTTILQYSKFNLMISCSAEVGGGGGRLQSHGRPTLTPGRLWHHFCPSYRWRWRFVSTLFQTA